MNTLTKDGVTSTYQYNSDGLRTSKKVGTDAQWNYTWEGSKLIAMENGSYRLHFFYDATGEVAGFRYYIPDGTYWRYMYVKNLQGDIIGLYTSSGKIIFNYEYDTWGRLISIKDFEGVTVNNPVSAMQGTAGGAARGAFTQNNLSTKKAPWDGTKPAWAQGTTGGGYSGKSGGKQSATGNVGHSKNGKLTNKQKEENAVIIFNNLTGRGWSKNSVCAILGNMDVESGINPGQWQSGQGPGYGLVQWDPASKYLGWATTSGYAEDSLMGQMEYLVSSMQPGSGEWFKNSGYAGYYLSYNDFITSTASVDHLTQVFLWSYERPSVPHTDRRIEQANYWNNFF